MVERTNLYVDQGLDYSIELELSDDFGVPLDISSYSFYGSIRKVYSATNVLNFNFNITSANTGGLEVFLNANNTYDLEPGKYQYDIISDSQDGRIKIVEGLLFLLPTNTKV